MNKKRSAPAYKAAFPKKLTGILELRGQEEQDAIDRMRHALAQHFAAIDTAHGPGLDRLGKATLAAQLH